MCVYVCVLLPCRWWRSRIWGCCPTRRAWPNVNQDHTEVESGDTHGRTYHRINATSEIYNLRPDGDMTLIVTLSVGGYQDTLRSSTWDPQRVSGVFIPAPLHCPHCVLCYLALVVEEVEQHEGR
jgi:hypothetical protein